MTKTKLEESERQCEFEEETIKLLEKEIEAQYSLHNTKVTEHKRQMEAKDLELEEFEKVLKMKKNKLEESEEKNLELKLQKHEQKEEQKKLHTIVSEQSRLMDDKDLELDEFEKVFRKKELFIANDKGAICGPYGV